MAELDVTDHTSRTTKVCTGVVEKIHKSDKDLCKARGQAKCCDIVQMQAGFELGQARRIWEQRGQYRIKHRKDHADVKEMLTLAKAEAGAGSSRATSTSLRDNPEFACLVERRSVHRLAGRSWDDRSALEQSWVQEWRDLGAVGQKVWCDLCDKEKKAKILDRLATHGMGDKKNVATDTHVEPEPEGKNHLGALANLCSKDMLLKRELVDNLLKAETSRGGVTELAGSLRASRTVFIPDTSEGFALGQMLVPPDARPRCIDAHPGYCVADGPNPEQVTLFRELPPHAQHGPAVGKR